MAAMSAPDVRLGIDFGGTGIKGAAVDLTTGTFAGPRRRIDTPEVSTPAAVVEVFREIIDFLEVPNGPVGVAVPGIVKHGVVGTAANIHPNWQGLDAHAYLTDALGREVTVLNDADAAGLAELRYGAAKGRDGLVVVTTLGTGIGSAFFMDGVLVPNTELGHMQLHGMVAEQWAATSARERDALSWEEWAVRLTEFYRLVERVFSPELVVVGGGVSKAYEKFLPYVEIDTELVPAVLRNRAGIIGAALATDPERFA